LVLAAKILGMLISVLLQWLASRVDMLKTFQYHFSEYRRKWGQSRKFGDLAVIWISFRSPSDLRTRLLTLFRTKMMSVTLTVLRPVSSTTAMASFRTYVIVSIEIEET
jgi:hypothetical protein